MIIIMILKTSDLISCFVHIIYALLFGRFHFDKSFVQKGIKLTMCVWRGGGSLSEIKTFVKKLACFCDFFRVNLECLLPKQVPACTRTLYIPV